MRTLEECQRFFEDLLTERELVEVRKRFHIAELLLKKLPQRAIESLVRAEWGNASTATIGKVKTALEGRGSRGGLVFICQKMGATG